MANATVDLWPDSIGTDLNVVETPVTILRQQAALLGEKTGNLVIGEVQSETESNEFVHSFYVMAPSLNYRYRLFTVRHTIMLYPLNLDREDGRGFHAQDAEDFKGLLRSEVLSTLRTQKIILGLISQVKA